MRECVYPQSGHVAGWVDRSSATNLRFWLWSLLGLFLFLSGGAPARALQIEVALDRNPVPINESFTVTFSAELEPDGDPDFTPIASKFEVLNQSRGTSYSAVNGTILRKYTWQLQLMAKESGVLEIPAITFGQDRSKPLPVTVTWSGGSRNRAPVPTSPQGGSNGAQDGPGVLLELDAVPKNPYVQAQVIVTVRVLSRIAFTGDLGQPEIEGILFEKLDPDRQYTAVRNGLQYRVDERRYAMFPQKSGPLSIPPVQLLGEFVDPASGMSMLGRGGKKFRLQSEAFNVDVRPIPKAYTGKIWIPASKLTLKDTWKPDTTTVAAGDAITRTLSIKAESVSSGVLPDFDDGVASKDFRHYPDQPVTKEDKTGSGLTSQRDQKIALIPKAPGQYTIPAIEIPWWNTAEDHMEVARLPARTVTVTPATGKPDETPEPLTPPASTVTPSAPAATPAETPAPEGGLMLRIKQEPLLWVAIAAILGWLLTGVAWFVRSRRRAEAKTEKEAEASSPEKKGALKVSDALKALRKASEADDLAATREALEAWSLEYWPGVSVEDRHEALRDFVGPELQSLNRGLYGKEDAAWDGKAFWRHLESRLLEAAKSQKKARPSLLESLYKS